MAAAAEEISVDVVITAVFIRTDWHFHNQAIPKIEKKGFHSNLDRRTQPLRPLLRPRHTWKDTDLLKNKGLRLELSKVKKRTHPWQKGPCVIVVTPHPWIYARLRGEGEGCVVSGSLLQSAECKLRWGGGVSALRWDDGGDSCVMKG